MSNKNYRKIRVFVASPIDVKRERDCLKDIVNDLNQSGGIAAEKGFFLEVLDWSTHVEPSMGRPEGVILDQLPVEEWDLFLGILWMRFGSPTGGIDPETGDRFASGTQEEFEIAYKSWQKNSRPRIHFYRSNSNFTPTQVDWKQAGEVNAFFERFKHDGKSPGLYELYTDIPDFEKRVRKNLSRYLKQIYKEISSSQGLKPTIEDGDKNKEFSPANLIEKKLKVGEVYRLAFLSIDIVDSGKLIRKYSEKKFQIVLNNYISFVLNSAKNFGGDIFSWTGDGGLLAFWEEDACNSTVWAGIKIMQEVVLFNLNSTLNPLKEPLRLRLAAHYGSVEFQIPTTKIAADCIAFVSHLENEITPPAAFTISDIVYNELDDKLKNIFVYFKKFLGSSIYVYTESSGVSSEKVRISESDIKGALKEIIDKRTILINNFKRTEISENLDEKIELFRTRLESIYNHIEYLFQFFSAYDSRWSKEYFQKLIKYVKTILAEDERIYKSVEELYVEWKSHDIDISPLLKFLGLLRINPIPNLKHLLKQFKSQVSGDIQIYPSQKNLFERIDKLIEADDFTEEIAFIELFLNEREPLIDFISNGEQDSRYEKLTSRLWKLADFVLLDDLIVRKEKKYHSAMVFQALSMFPENKKLFSTVLTLLVDKVIKSDVNLILESFQKYKIEITQRDLIIASKCLLVYHTNRGFRKSLIKHIGMNELWELISYYKTPLSVVQEICEHLYLLKINSTEKEGESENPDDSMKVFFDLVQKRLISLISTADIDTPLFQIRLMVIIFYKFDFFVEQGYFERLEELRLSLISKAKKFPNVLTDDLEDATKIIKKERENKGVRPVRVPRGVSKLPLPIQRRLAKDGLYIPHFINHSHHLIALETFRFINLNNIEAVLTSRGINSVLLSSLLEKEELFRKRHVVNLALNHPKCISRFALKYKHVLNNTELTKIANNPNANPEIRNYIKNSLRSRSS